MKRVYHVAFDVHCSFVEAAVLGPGPGSELRRARLQTTIPALMEFLESIPRPRKLTFEEGTLAGWLYRNLHDVVEELVVCDPRRNHLIAKDSDKDDPIDALKLAELYRGGYLKPVHHPQALDQAIAKQHVILYHDRVRQRVREANRIGALFRQHGVFVREKAFVDPDDRGVLLNRLPAHPLLRSDVELLWRGYDAVADQVFEMRSRLRRLGRTIEPVCRMEEVPGLSWIRAMTFYVFLDTPWRFRNKAALWRYLGIGLERRHSGQGPTYVKVSQQSNRVLRNVILGAAETTIRRRNNPYAIAYERWIAQEEGMSPRNALRNVARALAGTLWGMWKSGSAYRAELVLAGLQGEKMRTSS
jgi:transposase